MCMRCRNEQATRTCDQCIPRKPPAWALNKKHLCFACFTEEHSLSADVRSHTFTITKLSKASSLICCICSVDATRRCKGPPIKQQLLNEVNVYIEEATCIAADADTTDACTEGESSLIEFPSAKTFKELILRNKLPFSSERCNILYHECLNNGASGNGNSAIHVIEFWNNFIKIIETSKDECNDTYCSRCWNDTHRKGRRGKHEWVGFKSGASVCAMCERNIAERYCPECSDDLCTACAVATHLRGKKHRHVLTPLREVLLDKKLSHCQVCSMRHGNMECPLCDTPLCDSCLEFSHLECSQKGLVSDPERPTKCIVCGRPPDSKCTDCGDVYCSVKWMGNPGCFAKQHRKGHRRAHICEKYVYMEERAAVLKQSKKVKLKEEKELKRKQLRAAVDEQARLEEIVNKQNEREKRILREAHKIIETKKKNKTWLAIKLPTSHIPLLAPLKNAIAALGRNRREGNNDITTSTEK